jgi:formate C-acetyltransferase
MLQLNCLTKEILEDAQKNPQAHQDLIVRLYGMSARFVTLDPIRQQEFISRTILK